MSWIIPQDFTGQPGLYLLIVLAALVVTGVSKGGFGGVGSLAVPLLLLVMGPERALGMWLPLMIWLDVLTIRSYPREWQLRPILLMAPWMLAGIVVGWYLLGRLDARVLKLFVGGLSVVFVALEWVRGLIARRRQAQTWRPGWWTASPFGLAAGVSTMVAHAAGPVTSIYFLLQRMDPRSFVGTAARFYFLFNSVKVPFLVQRGFINGESLTLSLWLVPLAPLTIWLGSVMNQWMSPVVFTRVIHVLLVVTGIYLIATNWSG